MEELLSCVFNVKYKKLVPQLQDDLKNYDVTSSLSPFRISKDLNIKRVFYRSITLFVSAVGRAYGLRQNSSFEIIDELKQKGLLSKKSAQRLSLAVAAACHIRLAHYASKKRQEDTMYKEDETSGGKEKVKEMEKIVNIKWLVKSLVTAQALQAILSMNAGIDDFDFFLNSAEIQIYSMIMLYLGQNQELMRFAENYFEKRSELNSFEHSAFATICSAYRNAKQYEKCLGFINRFKRKMPKPPAKTHSLFIGGQEIKINLQLPTDVDSNNYALSQNTILRLEAECLLDLQRYPSALDKSDKLLKSNPEASVRCLVLLCNSKCKIRLKRYREGLSGLRDHLKLVSVLREQQQLHHVMTTPQTIQYIGVCLVLVGHREQGLHWLKEGLHYVNVTKAVSLYTEQFQSLIEIIKTRPVSAVEKMFLGE